MDASRTCAFAVALLLALPVATGARAQSQAPTKKGNDAAIQRQAEQIRRLTEAQQRLQADNSNLAARQSVLEEDLAAAKTARDRTAADRRQLEARLATARRELEASEAKAARLEGELGQARGEQQRLGERQAATEQSLAALREQTGALQAALRAREASLAQSLASDERRGSELARCREHNGALALLSSELLTAIDRGGLGIALLGAEPFSGFKRVRIESLIQDYRDRIADHRLAEPKR
jgi:chromosome segregation ATPase